MANGLSDLELPSEMVEVGPKGPTFSVMGVSFSDLSQVINRHGPALMLLYARFMDLHQERQKSGQSVAVEDLGQLLTTAIGEFPEAVAFLIAVAAGEPDMVHKVRRMRLPVQLDALYKIMALTFVSEHDIKNMVEIVTQMMERTRIAIEMVSAETSGNGTGSFAGK